MNNKYDREITREEMKESGYEQTADGFWVGKEHFTEDEMKELGNEVIIDDPKPVVSLLSFNSGEVVISEMSDSLYGNTYRLHDPRLVVIEGASESSTTVTFADWMPLANTRQFDVSKDFVVCISEPIESLEKSYLSSKNG